MNFTLNFHVALLTLTSCAPFLGLLSRICVFMRATLFELPNVYCRRRLCVVTFSTKYDAQLPSVPDGTIAMYEQQRGSRFEVDQQRQVLAITRS
jgi:hypothetical protein